MKLLSVIVVAICSINLAEARSLKAFSESNDLVVRNSEGFNMFKPVSGNLTIDWFHQSVTLNIKTKSTCVGMCPAVMPMPIEVQIPIVKKFQDGCGAWHTVAKQDRRPVDGDLQVVEIVDNAKNTCKYLIAIPGLQVKYQESYVNRQTGKAITRSVVLTGTLH